MVFRTNGADNCEIKFNRIFPRLCIASKTLIGFSTGEAKVSTELNSVEFTGTVDAYWDGEKLYFKKYSTVKPLFAGLADVYREATAEEVHEFLDATFFVLDDGFKRDKIGERARKNIASILDAGEIDLNCDVTRSVYNDYANDYPELEFNIESDGKFRIINISDLTIVVSVLQERLYTSPITHEKRVASSTMTVS